MKIQEQDLYHGAALTQIVEHESFKALNRAGGKYGHYLVNADVHVFVKYRKPDESPWQFTLQQDELQAISEILNNNLRTLLCLVCGSVTICALDDNEINTVIDINSTKSQWIRVEAPPRRSCRASGSSGSLTGTIAHNSFPEKIFT